MKREKRIINYVDIEQIQDKESLIIDYEVKEDTLILKCSNHKKEYIKNTKKNITKLNKIIVKNKLKVASIIDEYENNSSERIIILGFSIILVLFSGMLIPFAFFTGLYIFFILTSVSFGFCGVITFIRVFGYVKLVKNIKFLKNTTKYKISNEFRLPSIKLLKLHN